MEAITSGLHEGLTLIVGPPGTGKTDVAVQIINLLYHNHPKQRTLLITHSNQALNQLFEKIAALGTFCSSPTSPVMVLTLCDRYRRAPSRAPGTRSRPACY